MIYITGDTHIPLDVSSIGKFIDKKKIKKNDILIITGDVGFGWNQGAVSNYWLDWFANQPFQIFFVDGNHENFDYLDNLPIVEKDDCKAHQLRDNIFHFLRGQIATICGMTFFMFGGGDSLDKNVRIPHISWWPREMPSDMEYRMGLANLEKANWKVDYIISHSCSQITFSKFAQKYRMQPIITSINQYFDILEQKVEFKHWYAGHYHIDEKIDDKHTVLYNDIIKITKDKKK
jgi:hypothetical protein